MITHDTPAALDARPNSLKISKSAFFLKKCWVPPRRSGPRAKALKCMGKENASANQAQKRCYCLNHRNVLYAPAGRKRHTTARSQKDSSPRSKIGPD